MWIWILVGTLSAGYVAKRVFFPAPPSGPKLPTVTTGDLAMWSKNKGVPAEKLIPPGGQKFMSPNTRFPEGREYLVEAPNVAEARVALMKSKILSTPYVELPLLRTMQGLALDVGADWRAAADKEISGKYEAIAAKIEEYGEKSGNLYAMAFAQAAGWLVRHYNLFGTGGADARTEYQAVEAAETSQIAVADALANLVPVPWHTLEVKPDSLGMMQVVADILVGNAAQFAILPPHGRDFVSAWFTIFLSLLSDGDVLKAVNGLHGGRAGGYNQASDEQVYIVGLVFAKAAGLPPEEHEKFIAELWNRAGGWAAYPALLTNSNANSMGAALMKGTDVADFGNSETVWRSLGVWKPEDVGDAGTSAGASIVRNALAVQYLNLCVTGFQMLSEKTHGESPVTPGRARIATKTSIKVARALVSK